MEFVQAIRNWRPAIVAVDCFCNVVVCTLTLQRAYPGETLSAHCWRSYNAGKPFGRLLKPAIDALFALEKPDSTLVDEQLRPIGSHCRRAFEKTKRGDHLPPEYRKES
jgi:hypothetical protein